MPYLLQYVLKLSLCLALVYLFYHAVLRRLTFYNWNRFYLFGYTIVCFFIPLINITGVLERNQVLNNKVVLFIPSITGADNNHAANYVPVHHSTGSIAAWDVVAVLIFGGMIILVLRLLMRLVSFKKMMRRSKLVCNDEIRFYRVDKTIIPFSFGNSIFINPDLHDKEELKEIIRHEFV